MLDHFTFRMITKRVSRLGSDIEKYIRGNKKHYYELEKLKNFEDRKNNIVLQISNLAVSGVVNYQSDEVQYLNYRLCKIQSSINRASHNAIGCM